jgi:hypothetical protein
MVSEAIAKAASDVDVGGPGSGSSPVAEGQDAPVVAMYPAALDRYAARCDIDVTKLWYRPPD